MTVTTVYIYIITSVYYCTCMSLCIINTCSPIQMRGLIPLSKIKLNVINTDFGGLYCPGIVHLLIFSYVHYAHNAFTFALRSVRAYRFKSAHCAFTKRLLFAHRSFSVYISVSPVSSIRNSKVIGSVLEC